ncbi:MAG: hypothetical protein R2795_21675 [Saprospiraceae bacterium]
MMYRLDRTAFRTQSVESASRNYLYWKDKSVEDRLRAAWYLTCCAYQYSQDNPPRMERATVVKREFMVKHHFNTDFIDFIEVLNQANVRYVLVGGYSVIIHGYNRTTECLELWVDQTADNHSALTVAFQQFGMSLFDMTLDRFMSNELDVFTLGGHL